MLLIHCVVILNGIIYVICVLSASVLEGESDIMITRLIINDADTDKSNIDSMVQLISAIGMTDSMDG